MTAPLPVAPVTSKKSAKSASKKTASKKTASKKTASKTAVEPATNLTPVAAAVVEPVASEPMETHTPLSPVETLTDDQKAERARIKAERVAARRAETEARNAERKAKLAEPEPIEPEPEPEPIDSRDVALIDEIAELLSQFEAIRDRSRDLRRALRNLAHPAAAPLVLALFDRDGDPFQLRTHLLVALERMPEDAYFAALLDAMPRLSEQAPEWAFSALMRLLNTREHADDSAFRFEAAARQAPASIREAVAELLLENVEDLPEDQATMVVQVITALTR